MATPVIERYRDVVAAQSAAHESEPEAKAGSALSLMINKNPETIYGELKLIAPFFGYKKNPDQALNDAARAFYLTPNKYIWANTLEGFALCIGEDDWINWLGTTGGKIRSFRSFIEWSAGSSIMYKSGKNTEPGFNQIPLIAKIEPQQYDVIAHFINPAAFDALCHYPIVCLLAFSICLEKLLVHRGSKSHFALVLALSIVAVVYAVFTSLTTVIAPRSVVPMNVVAWLILAVSLTQLWSFSERPNYKGRAWSLSLPTIIGFYAFALSFVLLRTSLPIYYANQSDTASLLSTPVEKERWFKLHGRECNLIFVGDSRTWNGIHPDIMDNLLGTHSVNMAAPAHWLPTQYPYYQDLVKNIAPGATVILSVGNINFKKGTIQNGYPIQLKNVPLYLQWGFSLDEIGSNLIHFNPFTQLIDLRGKLHQDLNDFFESPICKIPSSNCRYDRDSIAGREPSNQKASLTESSSAPESADEGLLPSRSTKEDLKSREKVLEAHYLALPHIAAVTFPEEESAIRSVVLMRDRGSYYRVVLEPEFFRRKQQEYHKGVQEPVSNWKFEDSPAYWHNFQAIVQLFKQNNIKLVVNEVQEAPCAFYDRRHHDLCESYMKGKVASYVRSMGFPYISVDFSKFTDNDYFDYDHFHAVGSERYDRALAEQLRPFLKAR